MNTLAAPSSLTEALERLGFEFRSGFWRNNGYELSRTAGWLEIESHCPPRNNSSTNHLNHLSGGIGQPGLWKNLVARWGSRRVCALPLEAPRSAGDGSPLDLETLVGIDELLSWVQRTDESDPHCAWAPPERMEIAAWLPERRLAVQCGGLLRRIDVQREPNRFALRVSLVEGVSKGIEPHRLDWLDHLIADAGAMWRMPRLGRLEQSGRWNLVAEVDLTGAPNGSIEFLTLAGLDSLHAVVAQLAETVELLADATVALELPAVHNQPPTLEASHDGNR